MICTVMGHGSEPYDFVDKKTDKQVKGTKYMISVSCGEYPIDKEKGVTGEGEMCDKFKCDKILTESVSVGDVVSLDIDYPNGYGTVGRVKSAMVQVEVNGQYYFLPVY